MQFMDVSIVIPAFNAAATMGECLAAVAAQATDHGHCDVIVVDDGSSDETPLVAAEHGATVIRQANQGQAAARNAGVQRSTAGIVVFTDADCVPAPAGWTGCWSRLRTRTSPPVRAHT